MVWLNCEVISWKYAPPYLHCKVPPYLHYLTYGCISQGSTREAGPLGDTSMYIKGFALVSWNVEFGHWWGSFCKTVIIMDCAGAYSPRAGRYEHRCAVGEIQSKLEPTSISWIPTGIDWNQVSFHFLWRWCCGCPAEPRAHSDSIKHIFPAQES